MWRHVFGVMLAAGCNFSGEGMLDGSVAGSGDSTPGAETAGQFCLGEGSFEVCLPSKPTTPLNVNSPLDQPITTDDCTVKMMVGGNLACVVAASSVAISGRLAGEIPLPLVVVSFGDIAVNDGGVIDVSHGRAGANPASCDPGTVGQTSGSSGAGGAGGSFAGAGAQGGKGDGNNADGGSPGAAASAPFALRGGCDGQDGRNGATATAGSRGSGGGALYLLAAGSIVINGYVDASGAAGGGGLHSKGGAGGGGSGGLIVFHATTLQVNSGARVYANGGGGGGGADNGNDGAPGRTSSTVTLIPAGGAKGGPAGADGGRGAYATMDPVTPSDADNGGGGGGGGIGAIRVLSGGLPLSSTIGVSPPATN